MKLFNDICIHFALEKEIGKIVILKEHAETLCSVLKRRIFNLSIDSSSLNNFSSSFLHLLQITERTVFSNSYDILGFSNFLYLQQKTQYNFFIFLVIENILVLFYHSSHN